MRGVFGSIPFGAPVRSGALGVQKAQAAALPVGARDRSHQLQGAVAEGSRSTLEEPADGDADRHGAEEPHLEDLDDHSALPPLEFLFFLDLSTRWQGKLTER